VELVGDSAAAFATLRCWGFVIDGKLDDGGKDCVLYNLGYMYSNQGRLNEA
jgi:hypothetical protein